MGIDETGLSLFGKEKEADADEAVDCPSVL